MRKFFLGALSLAVAASLSAEVFATVNGKDITDVDLAPMLAGMPGVNFNQLPDDIKKQAIDRAIDAKLLTDEAIKSGIKKDKIYKDELELVENSLALKAWQAKILIDTKVADKEISDFYNKNKNSFVEPAAISASHILVEKEADAKKIITDLSKLKGEELNKEFAKVANEKSIDPSGKATSGNLGWFTKEQMVEPFANAVDALKKGEISKTPVKSQFGYHVILKHDSRDKRQVSLDEAKPYIENIVRQEKASKSVMDKLENLRKSAKIEYKK